MERTGRMSKGEEALLPVLAPRRDLQPSAETALSVRHSSVALELASPRYVLGHVISPEEDPEDPEVEMRRPTARWSEDDALTAALSALYAKLLVVMGIAFPVTEVLSPVVPTSFYQAFYMYLYVGSLVFMGFMYAAMLKERAVTNIIKSYGKNDEKDFYGRPRRCLAPVVRYGSFYLRLGAIGFGIGSMVHSGLEFGQFFELRRGLQCRHILQALAPATRMLLTLVQMQFIFLSSRSMQMNLYKVVARFGLMHMIATNLCEWLYVLVEETKHEIVHLNGDHDGHLSDESADDNVTWYNTSGANITVHGCRRTNIMGQLVQTASPYLFPCTIEYSLICAVILYEMWKDVKGGSSDEEDEGSRSSKEMYHNMGGVFGASLTPRSAHHLSVDCANAHKGLFAGILLLVLTIISLILFFVLHDTPEHRGLAVLQVNVIEMLLYIVSTVAAVACMARMRQLRYERGGRRLGLDCSLLVTAQTGTYVYCVFSVVGWRFAGDAAAGLATELCALVQTTCQTVLVLDASWRRCCSASQSRRQPGRQLVTLLLIVNLALWTINTLEKGHAEFRPAHLGFFGVWAWTIITHISMPLAIFYRFHSTICLFEIWKSSYKLKTEIS